MQSDVCTVIPPVSTLNAKPQAPSAPVAGVAERLLRDRARLVDDISAGVGLAATARTMLAVIAVGGAIFGAAVGAYRGGIQIAYAGIKLPLLLVLTAALAAPALTAFQ